MKRCFLKLSLCLSIITTLISSCGNPELMSKLGLNSESRELKTFLNDKVKELEGEF